MIGLVLVTHGRLADEFRNAVEHVVGRQEYFVTVCIGPDDNMENRRDDILSAVAEADAGSGVIILTDMFGGTPSNLAISAMSPGKVEVIAGVNLPMLLRTVSYRHESLDALVSRAMVGATQGVIQVAVTAPQNQARRQTHDQDHRDHQQ